MCLQQNFEFPKDEKGRSFQVGTIIFKFVTSVFSVLCRTDMSVNQ